MNEPRPILTDICWTLYSSNTTFDFLDWLITEPGYLRLRRWMRIPLVRYANLAWLRLTHHDILRSLALRYTHIYNDEQLMVKAETFVTQVLAHKQIAAAWEIIQARKVIIASGTMPVLANLIGQQCHAEAVHATSIYKHELLNQFADYDILTDNLSDAPLAERAHHAFIVVYHNQHKWDKILRHTPHTYIYADTDKY